MSLARLRSFRDGEPGGSPILWRRSIADFRELGEQPEADRTEVLGGEVLGRPAMSALHAGAMAGLLNVVRNLKPELALFAVQDSLLLDTDNVPRPDLMLLRPREDFYEESPPMAADALLIVELSDNPKAYELPTKVPLYARHQVPELWIVDLQAGGLIRMKEPYGESYKTMRQKNGEGTAAALLNFIQQLGE